MEDQLLQYGAVGLIALLALIAVRELFKREIEAHKQETERANRLEAELRKLNETVQNQYISTLTQATLAMSEAFDLIRELEYERGTGSATRRRVQRTTD